jgi:hypothetical protein
MMGLLESLEKRCAAQQFMRPNPDGSLQTVLLPVTLSRRELDTLLTICHAAVGYFAPPTEADMRLWGDQLEQERRDTLRVAVWRMQHEP